MEKIRLVGYWNGDEVHPEIDFNVPDSENDKRKLVVINLTVIEDTQTPNLGKCSDSLVKINKELKNLVNATRRLLK